jgi:hypothetical protein
MKASRKKHRMIAGRAGMNVLINWKRISNSR